MNKMHGTGTFWWPDGRSFSGAYRNDKKHGDGIFYWADGSKTIGHWEEGKQVQGVEGVTWYGS